MQGGTRTDFPRPAKIRHQQSRSAPVMRLLLLEMSEKHATEAAAVGQERANGGAFFTFVLRFLWAAFCGGDDWSSNTEEGPTSRCVVVATQAPSLTHAQ
jgi:hypothetical protein